MRFLNTSDDWTSPIRRQTVDLMQHETDFQLLAMAGRRVHDRASQLSRRRAVVLAMPVAIRLLLLSLFLSFRSFLHSLSPTLPLSLRQPSSSTTPFFSTQILHQLPPFYFIFFTFYTHTTSIHHHFLIFLLIHPISPTKTLTLTFLSLKIRPFGMFFGHSIVGFYLPTTKASICTPICHHFSPLSLSTKIPPPLKVQSLNNFLLGGFLLAHWCCSC